MAAPKATTHKVIEEDVEGKTCAIKITRTTTIENNTIVVASVAAGADPWARLAATGGSASASGRGSQSGWTHCPLCGIYSKKKHALGRGIANHLNDVHTPWNPGKLAQKIHRRQHERRERERKRSRKRKRPLKEEGTRKSDSNRDGNGNENDESANQGNSDYCFMSSDAFKPLASWAPTEDDKKAWAEKMVEILRKIEEENILIHFSDPNTATVERGPNDNLSKTRLRDEPEKETKSLDKTGKKVIAYRDSLPPFLMAASKGDLPKLQELVKEAKKNDQRKPAILSDSLKTGETDQNQSKAEEVRNNHHLRILLNTRDRHKSTADHWAAGGGHLDCLRYLYNLRASFGASENHNIGSKTPQNEQNLDISKSNKRSNKARRRDGKTCLHYAARNGHVHCIRYLLELESSDQPGHETLHTVDERSGEGTTPLHLACYGGHPRAVKYLVEEFGANPRVSNDWGCTCAHWAAMTISGSEADVKDLCGYLFLTCGVSFVETQGQGHTALHKAAHRQNWHVIRWMARSVSCGGAGMDPADIEKAGAPDQGGHKPSDIWKNMGGDVAFAEWMKSALGW